MQQGETEYPQMPLAQIQLKGSHPSFLYDVHGVFLFLLRLKGLQEESDGEVSVQLKLEGEVELLGPELL